MRIFILTLIVFSFFFVFAQENNDSVISQITLTKEEKQILRGKFKTMQQVQDELMKIQQLSFDPKKSAPNLLFTANLFIKNTSQLSGDEKEKLLFLCDRYGLSKNNPGKTCSKKKLFIKQLKVLSVKIFLYKLRLEAVKKLVRKSIKTLDENSVPGHLGLDKDLVNFKIITKNRIQKSRKRLKAGLEFLK